MVNDEGKTGSTGGLFATTQWSVILAAGRRGSPEARAALEALCQDYWYPVYALIRQLGNDPDDARDLTQGFFLYVLEKGTLGVARPERGRFRSFLRTALKNFLINEADRAHAQKRGGATRLLSLDYADGESRYRQEPAYAQDPAVLFEKRWAHTVLTTALNRLRTEFSHSPDSHRWHRLEGFLTGDPKCLRYRDVAVELGMTESAVKTAVYRTRKRFGELLRDEVSRTVTDRRAIDEEVRYLLTVIDS